MVKHLVFDLYGDHFSTPLKQESRQLYSVPNITSFISVYQRDNQIMNYELKSPRSQRKNKLRGKFYQSISTIIF